MFSNWPPGQVRSPPRLTRVEGVGGPGHGVDPHRSPRTQAAWSTADFCTIEPAPSPASNRGRGWLRLPAPGRRFACSIRAPRYRCPTHPRPDLMRSAARSRRFRRSVTHRKAAGEPTLEGTGIWDDTRTCDVLNESAAGSRPLRGDRLERGASADRGRERKISERRRDPRQLLGAPGGDVALDHAPHGADGGFGGQ